MKHPEYPFAAIVGQESLKTALLLAAVDWRLGVLLRGDKGSGKTTAARALAALLPEPARFVNLPLGATEDRLLGGIDLTRTLQGEAVFRPGLLHEANGGVLYVDEINLLQDHLADALLDVSATGALIVEREGFSTEHTAHFVLTGSMNPEEGSLRPQLLDRFALVVDVNTPEAAAERRMVVERRMAYDADPSAFARIWTEDQARIRESIIAARSVLSSVQLPANALDYISKIVSNHGVASLRADLAIARASCAYAALQGSRAVVEEHIDAVLLLALSHRLPRSRQPQPRTAPPAGQQPEPESENQGKGDGKERPEQRFPSLPLTAPALRWSAEGNRPSPQGHEDGSKGAVIRTRKTEHPQELDIRTSVMESYAYTGQARPSVEHLHEKVRQPLGGARYIFVVDSSGSHAAGQRMRAVKGAALGLIESSVHRRDEVAIVTFRGTSGEVLVAPTRDVDAVRNALEYLPTGGRTPLASGLEAAKELVNAKTLLLLLTDGRANVPSVTEDPWDDAVRAAKNIACRTLVIDTETSVNALGKAREFAELTGANYVTLDDFEAGFDFSALLTESPRRA